MENNFSTFLTTFFYIIYVKTKTRTQRRAATREAIIMDFMKMFMSAINVDAINNMSEEQLDKVNAIFNKSDMYKDVETEDEE